MKHDKLTSPANIVHWFAFSCNFYSIGIQSAHMEVNLQTMQSPKCLVCRINTVDYLQELISRCLCNWLTHWGRVTHICVSNLTSIGSDNGLSPGQRQAIIRTNAGILLIRPLGTNFSEFLVEIIIFSFKKMRLKVSSAKRRPFCLGLNELSCQSLECLWINYMADVWI